MHIKAKLITIPEATRLFSSSASRFRTWCAKGKIKPVRWTMTNGVRTALYSFSELAQLVAAMESPCPEGYISTLHASARLGVGRGTVRKWCQTGKLRMVVGKNKGKLTRWVCEADVAAYERTSLKSSETSTVVGLVHGDDVYEASASAPVLYGILTRDDVAVLERRLARMRDRGAMVA